MRLARKVTLALAAMSGTAFCSVQGIQHFGLGHHPQHHGANVAWWQSPGRIGGTINLNSLGGTRLSTQCEFGNDQHSAVLNWQFVRNNGTDDIYRFTVQINQHVPIVRTVAFDGTHAVVLQDAQSGTGLTIETKDLIPL